jgi:hypothetical protein
MAEPTWGLLEKSQTDPETIEEAIDRKIQDHENDSNAHIETGESLQSHKAAEVIDHAALSIIEDKLADQAVAGNKLKYDKILIETMWESLDNWQQYVFGSGSIDDYLGELYLTTGITINSIADVHAEVFNEGYATRMNKSPRFMCVVTLDQITNQEVYLTAGAWPDCAFGFKIVNGTLYALHNKAGTEYTTDISSELTLTNQLRYKAVYTSGSKIEFYIDDVLKATHTTNLPEDDPDEDTYLDWIRIRIKNTAAEQKKLHCRYAILTQDT